MEWFNYDDTTGHLKVRFRRIVNPENYFDDGTNEYNPKYEEYIKEVWPVTNLTEEEKDIINNRVRYLSSLPFVRINKDDLTLKDFDIQDGVG